MNLKKLRNIAATLGLFALVGCGYYGPSYVKPNGLTDEPKWPSVSMRSLERGSVGRVPSPHNLALVQAGMLKDTLYELLGTPEYARIWRSVEWTYVFRFPTDRTTEEHDIICLYKITFDSPKEEYMRARGFYWKPIHPVDAQCPPPSFFRDEHKMPIQTTIPSGQDGDFHIRYTYVPKLSAEDLKRQEMLREAKRKQQALLKQKAAAEAAAAKAATTTSAHVHAPVADTATTSKQKLGFFGRLRKALGILSDEE